MSGEDKRFYWLKMVQGWMDTPEIKRIRLRGEERGDTCALIYIKILLLSVEDNGKLYHENTEESFTESIAIDTGEDLEAVELTLKLLDQLHLIEHENGVYTLLQAAEMIGSETEAARRKRKQRQREKEGLISPEKEPADSHEDNGQSHKEVGQSHKGSGQSPNDVTKSHAILEKEKDKESEYRVREKSESVEKEKEPAADAPEELPENTRTLSFDDPEAWGTKYDNGMTLQTMWEKTFELYPKHTDSETAKRIWFELVIKENDPVEFSRVMCNAIILYMGDYKKKNEKDTDKNGKYLYTYTKTLTNWFSDEYPYWKAKAEEMSKKQEHGSSGKY